MKFSLKEYLFPLLIFIILLPFFIIKGEPYEGACDAGVYISSAFNLLEKGRYCYKFEELLPEDYEDISIKETNYQYKWKELYPGIINVHNKFVPQFFPLYPANLSIFYKIFKINGILFCNFWFFFISILIFYKISKLILKEFYSKISLILFSANPGIIYFIKYPSAEIFLSFFILSFLLFFFIFLKTNKDFFKIFGAIFLTLALLTKFFSYFLFGGLFLFFFFYDNKKKILKFFYFLSIFLIFPLISIVRFNYPYFLNHLLPEIRIKFIAIIILSSIIFLFFKKTLKFFPFLFFFLSLWATFIRPTAYEIGEQNNLKEFSWYFGILTLNISFLGALFSSFKKNLSFFTINYYLFLIITIFGTSDNPLHPFSFRRYIPLFFPLSCLYFSYLLKDIRIKKTISILILFISLIFPIYKGKNLILSREGKGFLNVYFQAVEKKFPDKTFCTEETFYLSSQLNLIGKKKIYPLHLGNEREIKNFQEFIKNHNSFYIFSSQDMDFEKVFEIEGEMEKVQNERNKIPENIEKLNLKFYLYKFEKKETNPFRINFFEDNFGRIGEFWGREFDGERYFRWTKRESFFYIKAKNEIVLLMDKGANPEVEVPFRIYYKNNILFEEFVKSGWNYYSFKVPQKFREKEVALRIVTHSFQPIPDTRELGLKVSEILSK